MQSYCGVLQQSVDVSSVLFKRLFFISDPPLNSHSRSWSCHRECPFYFNVGAANHSTARVGRFRSASPGLDVAPARTPLDLIVFLCRPRSVAPGDVCRDHPIQTRQPAAYLDWRRELLQRQWTQAGWHVRLRRALRISSAAVPTYAGARRVVHQHLSRSGIRHLLP